MIQMHFPTKVMVERVTKDAAWNEALAEMVTDYSANKMVHYASGFKHAVPNHMLNNYEGLELKEYASIMMDTFWRYLKEAWELTPEDISEPVCHMFGNHETRGEWSIPHAHHANQVVVTYYPKIVVSPDEPHPHAGKFVLYNPRTVQSGIFARREKLFTPINVESGTIIAFPAYAEHGTFPFFCAESHKYAIVTNIRFNGALEGKNTSAQYKSFQDING
jgi:hypothetical protein